MKRSKTLHTQDLVPIDEIKDGIIHTKDNRYIKIIELSPVNFHLRSESEKANIIYTFAAWLKIAPVKLQFKVITVPADISELVQTITKEIEGETNENCRELQKDNLDLICRIGYNESVTRRFFAIMEYDSFASQMSSYSEIVGTMNNCVTVAANFLGKCGNHVIYHQDEDLFLSELCFALYNRNTNESLASRVRSVFEDYAKCEETKGLEPSLADTLAPRYCHVEPTFLVLNNTYYTFMYIPSAHYRVDVAAGWLAGLINAGDGFDIDVFLDEKSKPKVRNKLGQQMRINAAKFKDTQDTNADYDDLQNALQSSYFIKRGLANNEDFYYMNIMITLSGPTLDIVKEKRKWVAELLASQDIEAKVCKYHMTDGFLSTLPLCQMAKSLDSRSKRNVLTYGAASTYVFTAYELTDNSGILLGKNQQNNSLCIMDPFDSSKYKNANGCILGTTGAGKTFLLMLMALRFRMKNIQTFIIAPLKGHEFKRACHAVGGEFIKLSPGSKYCINILEIRPLDKTADKLLDGEGYGTDDDSILSQKIQKVHTFFSLIIPDMSYAEVQILDNALMKAYAIKGITHDNESLIDHNKPLKNGLVQYKEMPILEDVYNVLKEQGEDAKRLALIMDRYVHGSAKSLNGQTNVDLANKYIVVDISNFNEEMQPVGMFVALDYIYDKVKEDRTKPKAVFIDEVWKLIGAKSNALAANFVLEIFKIIRGYAGGAYAATQDINDFFALEDGKYGKGIISNSKLKIVLQLEDKEAEKTQEILDLSDQETAAIEKYERGQGLISVNSNNIPIEIIASDLEEELLTTDPHRLEEIVRKRQMQKQKNLFFSAA